MKKFFNVLKVTVVTMEIICALWGFCCWAEIAVKNIRPNPEYSDWNILVRVVENAEVNN